MTINYLAVAVVTCIDMALGALWYSPLVFGKSWMALVSLPEAEVSPSAAKKGYAIAFLSALIRNYVLAWLVLLTDTVGIGPGLRLGIWIGVGLIGVSMAPAYYFTQRPRALYLIDAGLLAVSTLIATTLLAVW